SNPIQVLVKAVENAGLREDVTTIRRGGSRVSVSVDVAPLRRIDESLKNLSLGTLNATFKNKKSVEESLANELILASNGDQQSYAIKRRNEQERIAKAAR
ncbi:MAG: 30S ribosomal protein S7, partial [Candidatus Diapherotrites archaeon]|nr:30S ribosomal protein S7 [Candidatus Diapherotrites archaeon]